MVSRSAEVGQRVQAGQPLAQLDATDLRLGQEAAQAAVRAAQSAYDLAAAELKRYRELRDQGFISGLELERRETTLQAQQSQLDQARAQASVQGNQAAYAVLVAPAAGVVTAVEAEPGAVLAAGTPVLRLAHDGPRDVVFAVPEDGLAGMRALLGKAGRAAGAALGRHGHAAGHGARGGRRGRPGHAHLPGQGRHRRGAALQLGQTVTVLVDLPRRRGRDQVAADRGDAAAGPKRRSGCSTGRR